MAFGEKQLKCFGRESPRFVVTTPNIADCLLEHRLANAGQIVRKFRALVDDVLANRQIVLGFQRCVQFGDSRIEPLACHVFGIADDCVDVPQACCRDRT